MTVEHVARALNQAKVPFLVVGGVAVAFHGYGRGTKDLDLVIRLQPDAIERAFEALASLGYRPIIPITAAGFSDASQRARWISEKGMVVLNFQSDQHRSTPVDVFVSEPFDFQAEYDAAMPAQVAPGVSIRILRVAALVRLKKDAGRPRDLADIDELRKIHGARADA